MIPPEPFEDVRRARDQYAKERDVLAEALAAVLSLADRLAGSCRTSGIATQIRAVVAAPVAAAPGDVAARLEAYGHLARLRAEVDAAQRTAEPPTVAQAARQITGYYRDLPDGSMPASRVVAYAFERFANLLEGK
ncbi:MAG TPA: hypothetical protein VGP91_04305 [Actinoplanes sp.]|jgi:hypothetical protein|nr:hypothetical protein [Actinoplanes sp.]